VHIYLSAFVDFVLATSSKKATQVKKIIREQKQKQIYNPHEDWRVVRGAIQDYLRNGSAGDELDRVIERALPERRARYEAMVHGFLSVPRRRQLTWIEPPDLKFTHGGLTVTCKPDLGVLDKGTRNFVKLHYGARSPSRERVDVVAQVMRSAMKGVAPDTMFGVLDLRRSSVRTPRARSDMAYAIEEQAETFVRYWKDYQSGSSSKDVA
jgi:hypothetical protein